MPHDPSTGPDATPDGGSPYLRPTLNRVGPRSNSQAVGGENQTARTSPAHCPVRDAVKRPAVEFTRMVGFDRPAHHLTDPATGRPATQGLRP